MRSTVFRPTPHFKKADLVVAAVVNCYYGWNLEKPRFGAKQF